MIWDFLQGVFSSDMSHVPDMGFGPTVINPATGLPMLDANTSGVDVGGSPYGFDTHSDSVVGSSPWD